MLTDRALAESRRPKTGLQALAAVIGLGLVFAFVWFVWLGGGEASIHAQPASYYAQAYGSDPADVQRILLLSDCEKLDAWFAQANGAFQSAAPDTYESRSQAGLMAAAVDRMDDLGCPK